MHLNDFRPCQGAVCNDECSESTSFSLGQYLVTPSRASKRSFMSGLSAPQNIDIRLTPSIAVALQLFLRHCNPASSDKASGMTLKRPRSLTTDPPIGQPCPLSSSLPFRLIIGRGESEEVKLRSFTTKIHKA